MMKNVFGELEAIHVAHSLATVMVVQPKNDDENRVADRRHLFLSDDDRACSCLERHYLFVACGRLRSHDQ